jgi:predicted PurR-regulated permease PerM
MNNKPNLGNSISKMFQTNIKNPKTTEDIYDSNKNIESIIGEPNSVKPSVGEPSEISLDKTDNSSILNTNKNAFGGFGWFSISIIVIIILILIVVLYLYINKENNLNIQDFFSNTYNKYFSFRKTKI